MGDWLDRNRPAEGQIGILHGDFQFANVMFSRDTPRLAAVVDWELSSPGRPDARSGLDVDCPGRGRGSPGRDHSFAPAANLPTRAELVTSVRRTDRQEHADVPVVLRSGLLQARHHSGRLPSRGRSPVWRRRKQGTASIRSPPGCSKGRIVPRPRPSGSILAGPDLSLFCYICRGRFQGVRARSRSVRECFG